MNSLIWKSVSTLSIRTALLLLTALAIQPLYALDYPEEGVFAQGSKAWSENCARCHNMRSPSDLRDDQWATTIFHMRVRAGLTGQETRDILTFLQGSNARVENTDIGLVESTSMSSSGISGKQVYERNCLACHGANGKGSIPGVPDFNAKNGRLSKSDSALLSSIITGIQSPGSSMPMPPRGGNSQLTDADLNAALKYIKESFED
jgi:mono/diheme cytochrome c family protein